MLDQPEKAEFAGFSDENQIQKARNAEFLKELLTASSKGINENLLNNKQIYEQMQVNLQTESIQRSKFSMKSKSSSPLYSTEEAFILEKKNFADIFNNQNFYFSNNHDINCNNNYNDNSNNIYNNNNYNSNSYKSYSFNKSNNNKNQNQPQITKQTNLQKPKNVSVSNSQTLQAPRDHIAWQIAWHPQDALFASCGCDKNICIWGLDFTSKKYTIKAILEDSNNSEVKSIAWDSRGNYLASAGSDVYTNIWKKEGMDFECIATLESHESAVKSVAWSATGSFLLTCAEKNENVWIWKIRLEDEFTCDAELSVHKDEVRIVRWSPVDDVFFSCGGSDQVLKVWGRSRDRSDPEWGLINTLDGHKETIKDFAISKDALFVTSIGENGSVILWKIEDIQYKNILQIKKIEAGLINNRYVSCSINYNQDLIALGTSDKRIKLLYLDKKNTSQNLSELIETDSAHEDSINTVSFHVTKNFFISCSKDRTMKMWTIVEA